PARSAPSVRLARSTNAADAPAALAPPFQMFALQLRPVWSDGMAQLAQR
ncbi:MAG: hypothetical protein K0S86_5732, partial [Geminicoccaceae bacterium]|nr:hypothetical protein [Geminicoccaceae bacterium]